MSIREPGRETGREGREAEILKKEKQIEKMKKGQKGN